MKDGRITDDLRISRILPTLHELSRKGARVVVLSHFGRPDGKPVPEMSLKPVAARSEEHTSELQSLMRISYAVFCLKKKKYTKANITRCEGHKANITRLHLTTRDQNKMTRIRQKNG